MSRGHNIVEGAVFSPQLLTSILTSLIMEINMATSPVTHKASEDVLKAMALVTTTGKATKFWVELISLPPGNNNRLWLFVNNTWTDLPNASVGILESVQAAFANGSNLEVTVWSDNTNTIVGLVVRTP
jgi:hypothetical protein